MATPADTLKNDAKTHLKKPTPFHGDRRLVKKFLQECELYIIGNTKDFPDDTSKVIFVLSYMDDGEVEKWKQYYIDNKVYTTGEYVWPKASDFYIKVKEAFAFKDEKEESVHHSNTSPGKHLQCSEVLFHQKEFSSLPYPGNHLSDFLASHLN